MRATIRALRGEHTVLLSSHILPEISQTCDRLLIIQEGEIVDQGSEDELARRIGGGGGVVIEVDVAGGADTALAVLKQLPGIGGAAVVQSRRGGITSLRMEATADLRSQVARALVMGG